MAEQGPENLAERLGASRVVHLERPTVGGPLDMLGLASEVSGRLQSSGGRPSDPTWQLSRQIPFSETNWKQLKGYAAELSRGERRVGPGALAAILVERGIDQLQNDEWEATLAESREAPLRTGADVADFVGVTYRKLSSWIAGGLLRPTQKTGRQTWFGHDAIVQATWLHAVARGVEEATPKLLSFDLLASRYLVFTDGRVLSANSTAELARQLEETHAAGVLDQLPVRKRLLGQSQEPTPEESHDGLAQAI